MFLICVIEVNIKVPLLVGNSSISKVHSLDDWLCSFKGQVHTDSMAHPISCPVGTCKAIEAESVSLICI
jgi:hypothetical protein